MALPEHLQGITVDVTKAPDVEPVLDAEGNVVTPGVFGEYTLTVTLPRTFATLNDTQDALAHAYNLGLAKVNELRAQ